MNNFRIFFFSILVPLITVTLCSTGESPAITHRRHVLISQVKSRKIVTTIPQSIHGNCPSHGCKGNLNSYDKPRIKRSLITYPGTDVAEHGTPTQSVLSHHTSPLRLEIRSIKNATRNELSDRSGLLYQETGRHAPGYMGYPPGHINEGMLVSWFFELAWKAVKSYVFVYGAKLIFALIAYTFKLEDTYLDTHITLGNEGRHPFQHYGSKGESGIHGIGKVKGNNLYHPASIWYQQPSYKYHKGGKKFELHGYDQYQALKYAKKFSKKYAKKAHKYGLRPKPIGPYIPAYQKFGWR